VYASKSGVDRGHCKDDARRKEMVEFENCLATHTRPTSSVFGDGVAPAEGGTVRRNRGESKRVPDSFLDPLCCRR